MEHSPEEGQPNLDDVSKEAHQLFIEHQADTLQEAFHIQEALELIDRYLRDGTINLDMPLSEAMEKLAERVRELIGEEGEEE